MKLLVVAGSPYHVDNFLLAGIYVRLPHSACSVCLLMICGASEQVLGVL